MAWKKNKQFHHIVYEVRGDKGGIKQHEFGVNLWSTEHQLIYKIQRYKKVSKGFLTALRYEILRLEQNAEELE